MVFQNIDFHNVAQIVPWEDGYRLWRLPEDVRAQVNEGIRERIGGFGTGVELRFRLLGETAMIRLRTLPDLEAQTAFIYYGTFQGGWQDSSRPIGTEPTELVVHRPANMESLLAVRRERGLAFSPEVVRVVLPYGTCLFLGVDGAVEPPRPEDLPARTYLAYGSSITHGSLALGAPYTYPFRIAQKLGCDYFNLGFAGAAHLEKAMAEHIVSRWDWSFASVEMGVNMLGGFTEAEFERRVDEFTAILAADKRPVFATSIFGLRGADAERALVFRRIVDRYAGARLLYTPGEELLDDPAFVSQDDVHPTLEGMELIVSRWSAVMRAAL